MYLRSSRCFSFPVVLTGVFFVFLLGACNQRHTKPGPSGFADESFADKLSGLMPSPDTAGNMKRSLDNDIRMVYAMDDYQPIWVKENYASNAAAAKLIEELEDMQWDGVDPEQYNITAIKELKIKLDTSKRNSVEDAIAFDTALTRGYLAAAKFLLFGSISPRRADSLWHHVNDSLWNGPDKLVNQEGEYPSLENFRSEWPTYRLLRNEYMRFVMLQTDSSYLNAKFNIQPGQADSIMRMSAYYIIRSELPWVEPTENDTLSEHAQLLLSFQTYRSLRPTHKFDSSTLAELATTPELYLSRLRANMERLRWMKRTPGELYVVVDVPLMEMYLRKDGTNLLHKKVVVGRPARQTPSLNADMANIVINPPWAVPPTILKKDVLPGIQKSGNAYLAKKGLKIYDSEGRNVKVSAVNARNYRQYVYRQAPGDDNSLGYVKFNMPNKWDIYMHDTPHREDFGKRDRAQSSGCVRVHEPQEMALFILSELENRKNYTQGKLDTLISGHKTRWETLKNKIPVFITYLTAFEDAASEHILYTRDIYQRDAKLMSLMTKG
jgi:L,D-transpeptidase YcbB